MTNLTKQVDMNDATDVPGPRTAPALPLAFIYDQHTTPTKGPLVLRLGLCRETATQRGWEQAGEWIDRSDNTPTQTHRPRLEALLGILSRKASDRPVILLVADWDRLGPTHETRRTWCRRVEAAGGHVETVAGESSRTQPLGSRRPR